MLLDVAVWLETDRTSVAFLVATEGFLHARGIAISAGRRNVSVPNPKASGEVLRLYEASLVVRASSLIRLVSGLVPWPLISVMLVEWVEKHVCSVSGHSTV